MHQQDTNDRWAAEDAAAWDSAADSDGSTPSNATGSTGVLAQIPDLNATEPDPEESEGLASSDGRILGSGISTKLLVGGGIVLVLAAVIPFWLNSSGDPEGGQPPAPNADLAPTFDPERAPFPNPQPAPPNPWYEPNMSLAPDIPPGPDFTDPAGDPGNTASPQAVPLGRQVTPAGVGGPTALGTPGPRAKYDGRFEASRPDPGYYRPYYRSQAGPNRPQAEPNRPATIYDRPQDAAGGYRGDYQPIPRADYRTNRQKHYPAESRADYRTDYRRYYQADSRANPARDYRSGSVQPPSEDRYRPGVARFKGIIEQPSVRTTHERTGSGVY